MHIHTKRAGLAAALGLLFAAFALAFALPALADPSTDELPGVANSWRYGDGERIASPDTDHDAPADGDAGSSDVRPLALDFRVRKEGDTYVADFGGGHMTVTNAKAFGVDVSYWNGNNIDWARAKADGVDFAILRLGWGTYGETGGDGNSSTDVTFERNYREAKAAGVKVGVYLYSYAGWRPTESVAHWQDYASREADHVLTVFNNLGITPADLDYPVYYDVEESYLENETLHFGNDAINNREFIKSIDTIFCDKIQAAGYQPGVYANLNWWNNFLTDPIFENWERWVARYPYAGAPNQGSQYEGNHAMWQAHSEAYVEGIGTCDINFDYLDRSANQGQAPEPEEPNKYPDGSMVRLFNPSTGVHHFTLDQHEARQLENAGWEDEGVAWSCPTDGAPVYRLYNPYSGDHHFTLSQNERDGLVAAGWNDEGVAFHSYGKTPVYRLYNPELTEGTHHYTTSESERDSLVDEGWVYEAIGFVAV